MNTSLQLRWSSCPNHEHISERVISWLQNVSNTRIKPAKQTDHKSDTKKSKTVQYSIVNKCCFQQYEILFLNSKLNQTNTDWDEILHTPEQICFQDLPNFELNRTCESPADLKIQPEIGVLLGFSRTSSNWVFLKSRPKSATTRCMQWSEECNSPPINPQTKSSQRNQRFFTNNTRSGKRRNQDYKTSEIPAIVQTEIWSQRALWVGTVTLHLIKLENQEHSRSSKSLWNTRPNWCLPREKTRSSRMSAQNKWQPRDAEPTSPPLYL